MDLPPVVARFQHCCTMLDRGIIIVGSNPMPAGGANEDATTRTPQKTHTEENNKRASCEKGYRLNLFVFLLLPPSLNNR